MLQDVVLSSKNLGCSRRRSAVTTNDAELAKMVSDDAIMVQNVVVK
jgi:hypothetical protein